MPSALLGMGILENDKSKRIIMGIYYFSRKLYGKLIHSKKPDEIIEFLSTITRDIKPKRTLMENVREFQNNKAVNWLRDSKTEAVFSTPYYHEGNKKEPTEPL